MGVNFFKRNKIFGAFFLALCPKRGVDCSTVGVLDNISIASGLVGVTLLLRVVAKLSSSGLLRCVVCVILLLKLVIVLMLSLCYIILIVFVLWLFSNVVLGERPLLKL